MSCNSRTGETAAFRASAVSVSFWVGVYDVSGNRASSEEKVKVLLNTPKEHLVISMLPVGAAAMSI